MAVLTEPATLEEVAKTTPSPNDIIIDDIKEQVKNIEKSVILRDTRFMLRVLRSIPNTRKKLNEEVLNSILKHVYASGKDDIRMFCEENFDMEIDNTDTTVKKNEQKIIGGTIAKFSVPVEVNIYLHLLVLIHLIDERKDLKRAKTCANMLMEKILAQNRRTLDLLAAKCYFYYARVYELTGNLEQIRRFLLARLRTCTLRKDSEGIAVLINLILRNYITYNLFQQADLFASKLTFPESASNNEWARYFYYMGRIKAIHLEYSAAQRNLTQALRKGPQNSALGFKQAINKLLVVTQLLLGEIPERQIFKDSTLRDALSPYFELTQSVRLGDLDMFHSVLAKHERKFISDSTYTLIQRLSRMVLKTGIKKIAQSYSRIPISDVTLKLGLTHDHNNTAAGSKMTVTTNTSSKTNKPNEKNKNLFSGLSSIADCEYVIAKAIRDCVIDSCLVHFDAPASKNAGKRGTETNSEKSKTTTVYLVNGRLGRILTGLCGQNYELFAQTSMISGFLPASTAPPSSNHADQLIFDNKNDQAQQKQWLNSLMSDGFIISGCDTLIGNNNNCFNSGISNASNVINEEPNRIFHERITFCMEIYDKCVKGFELSSVNSNCSRVNLNSLRSLRYPPKIVEDTESNENRREKEQLDMEIAKQLAESDEDDFF